MCVVFGQGIEGGGEFISPLTKLKESLPFFFPQKKFGIKFRINFLSSER